MDAPDPGVGGRVATELVPGVPGRVDTCSCAALAVLLRRTMPPGGEGAGVLANFPGEGTGVFASFPGDGAGVSASFPGEGFGV